MSGKVKAIEVPLSDRTFIIGDAELMGYVGVETTSALHKKFFEKGLRPSSIIGRTKYYSRTMVDKFILKNSEYQEVIIH